MPEQYRPTPPDEAGDEEEQDVQAMAESLREGLKDPGTRKHLRRLANAAMGDEPTDAWSPDDKLEHPLGG